MTDSTAGGATVDVSHYSFTRACYRGEREIQWGIYSPSAFNAQLAIGRQLFVVVFWSYYVQIGIYRNNTNAVQTVLIRGNSYMYNDVVSDKYFISAVTFGEDEVFNPPFLNYLLNGEIIQKNDIEEYLDYCQIRRMYELTSPVSSTATVTEIRIPYSYLNWRFIDSEHKVYNEDGSLKDGYISQNYMFSDFEN